MKYIGGKINIGHVPYIMFHNCVIFQTYVQDLIQRNATDVFRLVVKENGHFYICGSIQMASDVKQMLRYVIQTIGRLSDSQVDQYMDTMKVRTYIFIIDFIVCSLSDMLHSKL